MIHICLFFPRDAPYESPKGEFGADGLFLAGGFGGWNRGIYKGGLESGTKW